MPWCVGNFKIVKVSGVELGNLGQCINSMNFEYQAPTVTWLGDPGAPEQKLVEEYDMLLSGASTVDSWEAISSAFKKILEVCCIDEKDEFRFILEDIASYLEHLRRKTDEEYRTKFYVIDMLKDMTKGVVSFKRQLPNFLDMDGPTCGAFNAIISDIDDVMVVNRGKCFKLKDKQGVWEMLRRLTRTITMKPVTSLLQRDGSCGFYAVFNAFTSPILLSMVRNKVIKILQEKDGDTTSRKTALWMGYVILYRFQIQNTSNPNTWRCARMLIRCLLTLMPPPDKKFLHSIKQYFLHRKNGAINLSTNCPWVTKLSLFISKALFPDGELIAYPPPPEQRIKYIEAAYVVVFKNHAITKLPETKGKPSTFVDPNNADEVLDTDTKYWGYEHEKRTALTLFVVRKEIYSARRTLIRVERLRALRHVALGGDNIYVKIGDSEPHDVYLLDSHLECKPAGSTHSFELYREQFTLDEWRGIQGKLGTSWSMSMKGLSAAQGSTRQTTSPLSRWPKQKRDEDRFQTDLLNLLTSTKSLFGDTILVVRVLKIMVGFDKVFTLTHSSMTNEWEFYLDVAARVAENKPSNVGLEIHESPAPDSSTTSKKSFLSWVPQLKTRTSSTVMPLPVLPTPSAATTFRRPSSVSVRPPPLLGTPNTTQASMGTFVPTWLL
jgi:hypothetical protein